jgi:hypothetical protein
MTNLCTLDDLISWFDMIQFTATIIKMGEQAHQTGWTYITIPQALAQQLIPNNKKSFRVKGQLDAYTIKGVAVLPDGDGGFLLPLNATMRKAIGKRQGATLLVKLQVDKEPLTVPPDFWECLQDEPAALERFNNGLLPSHRNYFIKWVDGVKGETARAKRIAMAIDALNRGWSFQEMFWAAKGKQ